MASSISSVSQIDVAWLNEALRSAGRLKSEVTGVAVETIGSGVGLMGELGRLRLSYAGEEDLPDTMIAKCAAQTPENKGVAQVLDFYNREVNFYNNIAADCPMRVPVSYFGKVYDDTYDCAILMEDLGDVTPRDQIEGASIDDAHHAVQDIAAMHTQYWGKARQPEYAWMYDFQSEAEAARLRDMVYMPALEPALSNFSELIPPSLKKVCKEVGERYVEFWAQRQSPHETFVHGDYRQDNIIYIEDQDSKIRSIVMDWQISGVGKGVFDVTYFLCQSLPSDVRAKVEKDLVEDYFEALCRDGVSDYTFNECWEDYRLFVLGCLIYPITVCGTLDLANERGRALATVMLERNLAAIHDLNCVDLM